MGSFRELELSDKPSFDRILALAQPETSDLTFTNLFMWKHNYGLKVSYLEDLDYWLLLAVPPVPKWKPFFLAPIGDWNNLEKLSVVLQRMIEVSRLNRSEMRIRRIPKQLVEAWQEIDPKLIVKEERYTFDYLYRSEDLINLAGRKLHSKRNHWNQFQRKYSWEYQALTPELAVECLQLRMPWFDLSGALGQDGTDEEKAMVTVLSNFEVLGLSGGLIRVDGWIQALAVGEQLNANTAVTHIEKANTEFDGVYIAINQQFTAHRWSEIELINREEDMGIEGLRKSKLSYQPFKLVEKYCLSKKGCS